jgi:hypothetical protein
MSRAVPQFTPTRLRAEISRIGAELSDHHHQLAELQRTPTPDPTHAAAMSWHEGRIQTLEDALEDTQTALAALERADEQSLPELREKVLAVARAFGQATPQAIIALAHPPGMPDRDATSRRVHKIFDELVDEAEQGREGLMGSGEHGLAANGRGRPPEMYVHVPASSAATNGHSTRTRRTGRAKRAT